jgi:hypothetical protein
LKYFILDLLLSFTLAIFFIDPKIVLLYFGFKLIGVYYLKYIIQGSDSKVISIYTLVYLIFMSYLCLTHFINVNDPLVDYFYHNDQIVFYEDALSIGTLKWSEIIDGSILNLRYSEYPLFALFIGLLYKFGSFINVTDILLFFKMSVVLFASLIPAMIASMMNFLKLKYNSSTIIIFSFFSYILIQSVVFTRDLHVAFFYILLTYLILVPTTKIRIIKILFVIILIIGLRIEQGLFSFLFLFIFFISQDNFSKYFKFFTIFILLSSAFYFKVYDLITDIFIEASDIFKDQTTSNATNLNSLYLKFIDLPIPFNLIFVFIYTIIMPYPLFIWVKDDITLLPSIMTPFYWLFILIISIISLFGKLKKFNILDLFFMACLLSIILSSFIEANVRRNFAVYPIIFLYYLSVNNNFSLKFKKNVFYFCIIFIGLINIFAYSYILNK